MSWTKRELITQAFEEIGLASYVFDLSPEQLQAALRRLDAMMATWNARGIRLGYTIPATAGGSTLDDLSGVPDAAQEAVVSNLAMRLASTVGKTVPPEMMATAKQAYNVLLSRAAKPPEMQMPRGTPAGAGNKSRAGTDRPFLDEPTDELEAGPDGDLEFD